MIVIALVIIALVIIVIYKRRSFTSEEDRNGNEALQELEHRLARGEEIPHLTEEELEDLIDKVYLIKTPQKEEYRTLNQTYWPQYYYSNPYQHYHGRVWPKGMFSRMRLWSPGFHTSGWMYQMRPGLKYRHPRSRWVRNNNSYYYLNNTGYD